MTLLVSWVGVDTHGPGSVYIATDSRISWKAGAKFEMGRKVFAFKNSPDILGYCGDVLFPSIALNQIVELADNGLLFKDEYSSKGKFNAIVNKLNQLLAVYPKQHSGIVENELSIIYASRGMANKKFCSYLISWSSLKGWQGKEVTFPSKSGVLFVLGTGANEFSDRYEKYKLGPHADTSRSVFQCFCDVVANTKDKYVGGAPQLVSVYRKPFSNANNYGIVYKRSRYFLGAKIDNLSNFNKVAWRNEGFELCNGKTMNKLPEAQLQPDPLRRL